MNSLFLLLVAATIFLPLIIGYGRCLGHWRMMQIWLWLLLPVAGWFVAMAIAMRRE